MIRNSMPQHSDAGQDETESARATRVKALRDAYLAGTLDLSIPDEGSGLRRLLRDVFSPSNGPRRP